MYVCSCLNLCCTGQMADTPEYSIALNHYRIWYNMADGVKKLRKGPLCYPFKLLCPADRFHRIQHLHFRTWCNLPAGREKERMPMLIERPPVSNYVWRYPPHHPWDDLSLTGIARYTCWEKTSIFTVFRVMVRNQVIKPLCKNIIEFLNPYTKENMARARRKAEERAELRKRRRVELARLQE